MVAWGVFMREDSYLQKSKTNVLSVVVAVVGVLSFVPYGN